MSITDDLLETTWTDVERTAAATDTDGQDGDTDGQDGGDTDGQDGGDADGQDA